MAERESQIRSRRGRPGRRFVISLILMAEVVVDVSEGTSDGVQDVFELPVSYSDLVQAKMMK